MGKEGVDQDDGKVVRSTWENAGPLLPLDGSGDEAWARKESNSDARGNLGTWIPVRKRMDLRRTSWRY